MKANIQFGDLLLLGAAYHVAIYPNGNQDGQKMVVVLDGRCPFTSAQGDPTEFGWACEDQLSNVHERLLQVA